LLVSTPLNQRRGLSKVEGRIKDQSVIVSRYLSRSWRGEWRDAKESQGHHADVGLA